jgi:hypothetical protein
MASIKEPQFVLPFVGLLTSAHFSSDTLSDQFVGGFGEIAMKSTNRRFTQTAYYNDEMGDYITRQWWVFKNLCDPSQLIDFKRMTNQIEQKYLNERKGRQVNIDPGIISMSNVILASTKNYSHRIYLGKGIYAEVTLIYKDKTYVVLDWTYPDYRESTTIDFFCKARTLLKETLTHVPE